MSKFISERKERVDERLATYAKQCEKTGFPMPKTRKDLEAEIQSLMREKISGSTTNSNFSDEIENLKSSLELEKEERSDKEIELNNVKKDLTLAKKDLTLSKKDLTELISELERSNAAARKMKTQIELITKQLHIQASNEVYGDTLSPRCK